MMFLSASLTDSSFAFYTDIPSFSHSLFVQNIILGKFSFFFLFFYTEKEREREKWKSSS